jgi:APA family basic amino acid/polyamine antiporter
VHPRFKTPHVSISAQAIWASVLIVTGSLDSLTNYVGFAITLFAGIAVAAVFVLRAKEPDAPRPYKALGYPIAPGIFVLASLAIVVNAVYRNPGTSGVGLLVILSGVPLYMWLTRGRRAG